MDKRIIYYNNFASHLLNAYNPNMLYPDLPHRWSDADWRALVDMAASFGYTVLEFWLVPRLFCREGLESEVGREFARQMNVVIERAAGHGLRVELIAGLATTGGDWRTLCPNIPEEWQEIQYLWDQWSRRLPELGIVGIFPGDPGACSRNGCTAETYIDRSVDIAHIVVRNLPGAQIEFHTWGPPFFGWGNLYEPPDSHGEFRQEHQHTAWTFDKARADRSMTHLLRRLLDFPEGTAVAINLGFNPDGNPTGEQDARPWAREIAKTNPILTWDFSLTEGENAIYPHYRFQRLFRRRQEELAAAPYSGGICFTMTPLLNQLSLYEAAWSFRDPSADHRAVQVDDGRRAVARRFFGELFGPQGETLAEYMPLFEIVPDWGHYAQVHHTRGEYHAEMQALVSLLQDLRGQERTTPFHPDVETYRRELLFFAQLFADLSGPNPDWTALRRRYWERVYAIYDRLPQHVDPRPKRATDSLIAFFQRPVFRGEGAGDGASAR